MANTIQIIINATDNASSVLRGIGGSAQALGDTFVSVGTELTKVTALTSVALTLATKSAISYDESITNAAAILGSTVEEQDAMSDSLLDFSRTAGHGGQAVADAYFDIVSGVADATTHMAILEASSKTAEAGQADLTSTNAALISSMNAYSLAADQATFVSDVMTRTFQGGVLTMDTLAAALPGVTTVAASMNIGLEEVGASLAFVTTKGVNANVATTAIRATMLSFLKPTESMTTALEELGFANGQSAIDTLGFQGALQALSETSEATENGMLDIVGSSRALQASLILSGEGAAEFADDFINSIDGATEAAGEIQFRAAQAHIDLFKSNLQGLSITVGNILMPRLVDLVDKGTEIVDNVINWISENEELTSEIVLFTAAIGALGPALIVIGKAIAIVSSPIGLLIGGITALKIAWDNNFLGMADAFGPILDQFVEGFNFLTQAVGWFIDDIKNFGISDAIKGAFGIGPASEGGQSWIEGVLATFGIGRDTAIQMVDTMLGLFNSISSFVTTSLIPNIQTLGQTMIDFWISIQPSLAALGDWFLNDILPAIITFITTIFIPAISGIADRLVQLWVEIQPPLTSLFDWFVVSALPMITSVINDVLIPAISTMIDIIFGIWDIIQPTLVSIFDWFVVSALPAIVTFVETVVIPIVSSLVDVVAGIWAIVEPPLSNFFGWFNEYGLPVITSAMDIFMLLVTGFGQLISLVLDVVTGDFSGMNATVTDIFTTLTNLIQAFTDFFSNVFKAGIDLAITGITTMFNGIWNTAIAVFGGIRDSIQWVIDKIQSLVGWISNIDLGIIEDAANTIGDVTSALGGGLTGTSPSDLIAQARASGTVGFASGTSFTGGGNPNNIAGFVHNQEAVVPRGGAPVIMPSPRGLILDNMPESGGSSNQITIQVSVSEAQLLTPELAEENGRLFGQRIEEELNFNG